MLHLKMELPTIPAGFPSPADDYLESDLSLDELVIKDKTSTFFIRVEGDSMIGAGIYDDDILVVDRAKKTRPGHVIVAVLDGEYTIKRFIKDGKGYALKPENPHYQNIPLDKYSNFKVWGVVIAVLHDPTL